VIGIGALIIAQVGSWLLSGRSKLPHRVGQDILALTHGYFFLDQRSLAEAPRGAQAALRDDLLAHPHVSEELELPPDNRKELGRTGSGEPIYSYEIPSFGITRWISTPIGAKVEFSIYGAPLGANGFQVRYWWILGFWVRRESQNPTWVSRLYNNTLNLAVTPLACARAAPAG
jgi:hypothetical protein